MPRLTYGLAAILVLLTACEQSPAAPSVTAVDVTGAWTGSWQVNTCTARGELATFVCGIYRPGNFERFTVSFTQTGTAITATLSAVGGDGQVTGRVAGDTITLNNTTLANGSLWRVRVEDWRSHVPLDNLMEGTMTWQLTGITLIGDATIHGEIRNLTRGGTSIF